MKKLVLVTACLALAATSLVAQNRKSPHESVSAKIGDSSVDITYGRPYAKGRKIVGGLVPYGEVWRTGADEATTLKTTGDLMIGDLAVPAGEYALFTLPTADGWKLIVNKTAKQWGAFKYDAAMDLGRTDMMVGKTGGAVEQFTIAVDGGKIVMSWEMTQASVSIAAK